MLTCYAVVIPGLESVAANELATLNVHDIQTSEGGVHFQASPEALMRVNLRARTLTRVLLRLKCFKAMSFPELFNKTSTIAWSDYVRSDGDIRVRADAHHSRLMHSSRIQQTVRAAMKQKLARQSPTAMPPSSLTVHVRFDNDICQLSLDTSGERLDRRGYRLHSGSAPMRETMAAALLQWMAWRPDQVLMVPMCGSGTLAIEAAWMARKIAPGLGHVFPFIGWPGFGERRWRKVYDKAQGMRCEAMLQIVLSDISADIVRQAVDNIDAAALADVLEPRVEDLFAMRPCADTGLIMLNPPYGQRIGHDPASLYQRIGRHLHRHFTGWRCMVLVPDQTSVQRLGLSVQRQLKIRHGGNWIVAVDVQIR